jgi:hypothetical protein
MSSPVEHTIIEKYFKSIFGIYFGITVRADVEYIDNNEFPCLAMDEHKTKGKIILSKMGLYYDYDEHAKTLSYDNVCQCCANSCFVKYKYKIETHVYKKVIYHRGQGFAKFLSRVLLPEIMEQIIHLMNQL